MSEPLLLKDLTAAVGRGNVITDPASLNLAEQTNYPTHQRIPLIVRPGSGDELRTCLLLAARHSCPVHVSSRGKNWGYGSRVPVKDGSILIELERMDRILDFDEQLGYMRVEPGVTFDQAFRFLRERRSGLLLGITGSSGTSSMLGNALERGIGTGVYADRFSAVCGLEVILPDGRTVRTGFERFDNARTGKVSRWGHGPQLDGLFSQSNLGVATAMTVWLTKCPPWFRLIFYKVRDPETLPRLLDVLQEMSMDGIVRPALTLYNDLRVISSMMQFPFDQTRPGEWGTEQLTAYLKARSPLAAMTGAWNGEISIRAASPEEAELQSRTITEKISGLTYDRAVITVSRDEALQLLEENYREPGKQNKELTLRGFLLGKYLGIPSEAAIGQAYWRKRTPRPPVMDPDRDRCGLIWFSPVTPFRGEDIFRALGIIRETAEKYAFEAALSLQCLSERAVHIIGSISWDRDADGEDRQAAACYREATALLEAAGYYSYRSATLDMPSGGTDATGQLLNEIKQTIDPKQILAAGKYIPGSSLAK